MKLKNIPYTYLLKHIPTGKFYYGVRYSKKCNPSDLWKTYFSSSYEVKKLIDEYGVDSFLYEIRKTFNSKKDAILWENKVLNRLKVNVSDKWLNKSVKLAPPIRDIVGDKNPMKCERQRRRMRDNNPTNDENVRLKISNSLKGRVGTFTGNTHTIETREKMKLAWETRKLNGWKYKHSDEHKEKISKALTGRKFTDETRKKISDSKKGKVCGSKNPAAKKIKFNGICYDTIKEASEITGISKYIIRKTMVEIL